MNWSLVRLLTTTAAKKGFKDSEAHLPPWLPGLVRLQLPRNAPRNGTFAQHFKYIFCELHNHTNTHCSM